MISLIIAQALAQPGPVPPVAPDIPAVQDPAEPAAVPRVPAPASVPPPSRALVDQELTVDEPMGDLFAMAQTIAITGPVGDNAFAMGESLHVGAPILGDLYGMGSTITIDAPVSGDVYSMGASVEITSAGSVGGNLTVGAGELTLLGPVGGALQAQVGRAVLGAPIGGDVVLDAADIETRTGLAIGGGLVYESPNQALDLESRTNGSIAYTRHIEEVVEVDVSRQEEESSWLWSAAWWSGMRAWGYVTKLLVGSLLFLLGGAAIARVGRELSNRPGASIGIGFVLAALLPIVSAMALGSIVLYPLGLLGFTALAVVLYIGQLFSAHALGEVLLRRFRPDAIGSPYISLAVGLVPLMALFALPWIGTLGWLVATLAGIGALGLRVSGRV